MAKPKTVFVCNSCGAESLKWQGQCADCGAWNSMEETRQEQRGTRPVGYAGERRSRPLGDLDEREDDRLGTGIGELDRVLGGGIVPGSVVLLGGDPGIGKSTLLLQAAAAMHEQAKVLYVTGEESLRQVGLRARRLGIDAARVQLLAETSVESLLAEAAATKPQVLVVDSIQTMYSDALQSAPGAVAQLRESTAQLVRLAKQSGIAVYLVGHVTKEGMIAGPRVLEHMVDVVLYFESEAGSRFRMIRAIKNRFGAANELGVFAMTDNGLKEVRNPSAIFLSRQVEAVPGSVITVAREGTRSLLLEVQALVDGSRIANPRRVTAGLDQRRLSLLLAVLHRHAGVSTFDQDVFVNVVGGMRIGETAADLAVLLATVSSFRNAALSREMVVFGELGLAGEVRPVPFGEERVIEAAKHGFARAVVPFANQPRKSVSGLEVIPVQRLEQALEAVF